MAAGSDLANLEALANIFANVTEIIGFAVGIDLLLTFWVPHFNGIKGYRAIMVITALLMMVVGLAAPGIVLMVMADKSAEATLAGAIVGALFAFFFLLIGACAYFLPSYFAFQARPKARRIPILICNIFAFLVPFAWIAVLFWSCKPDKEEVKTG